MEGQTIQVAFLLDTRRTNIAVETRYRSLCLACTRMLLFLSCFPNKAHHVAVKWQYHFFSSLGPATRMRVKSAQFLELKLDSLERMFHDLYSELHSTPGGCQSPLLLLYLAMVDIVHGYMWDSPDILSPVRVFKKDKQGEAILQKCAEYGPKNMLFICSPWPGLDESDLADNVFPPDLLALLKKKNISVYWLYEGEFFSINKALIRILDATALTGGNVIFLSSLISPLSSHNWRKISCQRSATASGNCTKQLTLESSMHKLTESSSPEHAFVPNLKLEANNSAAAAATTQSGDKQQLPCPQQEQRNFLPLASGSTSHQSSLEELQANIFKTLSVLPWNPFLNCYGVNKTTLKEFSDLQQDAMEGMFRTASINKVLSKLKTLRVIEEDCTEVMVLTTRPTSIQQQNDDVSGNLSEIICMLKSSYNEQVYSCTKGLPLYEWVASTFTKINKKLEHSKEIELWLWLKEYLLLDTKGLEDKYKMKKDGRKAKLQKMAECQFQVLLRLEGHRLSHDDKDKTVLAGELTSFLRKISLLETPIFLGHYLQEVILPFYSKSCPSVLLKVYESLMLPIPLDLSNNPGSHDKSPITQQSQEQSATGSESGSMHSLQELSATSRSLVHRTSFQGHRQITIMPRKGKKKKQTVHSFSKKHMDLHLRRCSVTHEQISSEEANKVCRRSLFIRSQSVTSLVKSKKMKVDNKNRDGKKKHIKGMKAGDPMAFTVKETPLKKQVDHYRRFKLQRLRSKNMCHSPEIVSIKESPQRSFYTSSSSEVLQPPKAPLGSKKPQMLLKKKLLSPTAIKCLLQRPILSSTDASPELFDSHLYKKTHAMKAARMLSYESEDPLRQQTRLEEQLDSQPIMESWNSTMQNVEPKPICLQTNLDPAECTDSASMAAFALSTPTKDEPMDFNKVLKDFI